MVDGNRKEEFFMRLGTEVESEGGDDECDADGI